VANGYEKGMRDEVNIACFLVSLFDGLVMALHTPLLLLKRTILFSLKSRPAADLPRENVFCTAPLTDSV
jgi:hypothetical protein